MHIETASGGKSQFYKEISFNPQTDQLTNIKGFNSFLFISLFWQTGRRQVKHLNNHLVLLQLIFITYINVVRIRIFERGDVA